MNPDYTQSNPAYGPQGGVPSPYTPQTPQQTPQNPPTSTQPQSSTGGMDMQAVHLAQAIRQIESGGNYQAPGDAGTSTGAYQWQPETWAAQSKQFLGQDIPLASATPQQQNAVAYSQIKTWKDEGYNAAQIAAMWNSGSPDGWENKVGTTMINGQPVKYNVPQYVKSVTDLYHQYESGTTAPTQAPTASQPAYTLNTSVMNRQQLQQIFTQAQAQGMTPESITQQAIKNGWLISSSQVQSGITQANQPMTGADVGNQVPNPVQAEAGVVTDAMKASSDAVSNAYSAIQAFGSGLTPTKIADAVTAVTGAVATPMGEALNVVTGGWLGKALNYLTTTLPQKAASQMDANDLKVFGFLNTVLSPNVQKVLLQDIPQSVGNIAGIMGGADEAREVDPAASTPAGGTVAGGVRASLKGTFVDAPVAAYWRATEIIPEKMTDFIPFKPDYDTAIQKVGALNQSDLGIRGRDLTYMQDRGFNYGKTIAEFYGDAIPHTTSPSGQTLLDTQPVIDKLEDAKGYMAPIVQQALDAQPASLSSYDNMVSQMKDVINARVDLSDVQKTAALKQVVPTADTIFESASNKYTDPSTGERYITNQELPSVKKSAYNASKYDTMTLKAEPASVTANKAAGLVFKNGIEAALPDGFAKDINTKIGEISETQDQLEKRNGQVSRAKRGIIGRVVPRVTGALAAHALTGGLGTFISELSEIAGWNVGPKIADWFESLPTKVRESVISDAQKSGNSALADTLRKGNRVIEETKAATAASVANILKLPQGDPSKIAIPLGPREDAPITGRMDRRPGFNETPQPDQPRLEQYDTLPERVPDRPAPRPYYPSIGEGGENTPRSNRSQIIPTKYKTKGR